MLGLQLANGVIQPLTNFLLNDLTNVQRKKSAFQAAGKGGYRNTGMWYNLLYSLAILFAEHDDVTAKYSKVSKVRETERV